MVQLPPLGRSHRDQAIPGLTGGALDSHEAEPGPLMIQGDHGSVEFRKLTLTLALPVKN